MNITQEFDTIAAISTPLGTGGIGVIRISGDRAFDIISKISDKTNFPSWHICHCWIKDGDKKLDEVVVLPFKSPKSYTGEDVIEIQCHGGVHVVQNILDLVLRYGARMAEKGEFTKRAFLNKRIDLSQAEAVDDLIHSKSSDFVACSAKNLSGVLANKIKEIRSKLFEASSRIVAGIDFPEDVSEPDYDWLISKFETAVYEIDEVLSGAKSSDILRQGVKIAVLGRPNVGKSSLFNALLNLDRAIVTDIAGTTRDVIKENIDLGMPVTLVDTAGIRDCDVDKVEKIGIEFSKQAASEADLILFMYDASVGFTNEDDEILQIINNKKHIIIANKIDLTDNFISKKTDEILLSTLSKEGLAELKEKIKALVLDLSPENLEYMTNKRQQVCLIRAKESLEKALEASKIHELQDMIYIDLKSALLALDEITGEIITDEILDNIFDHFCIGK